MTACAGRGENRKEAAEAEVETAPAERARARAEAARRCGREGVAAVVAVALFFSPMGESFSPFPAAARAARVGGRL